uniref:Lipoprotein n=1 Tax=candidate division WOR-3 bacterium TaxID=2052148 RepID=A0A7V3ZZD0_UNCW3
MERNGKNIYYILKALLFSLPLFILACAPRTTKGSDLRVSIKPISCELANIELKKIDFLYQLSVINKGNQDIQINKMTYEFYINDEKVSEGDYLSAPVKIRAKNTRNLQKFIPVPEELQSSKVKTAIRERKGIYTLKIKAVISSISEETREIDEVVKLKIK